MSRWIRVIALLVGAATWATAADAKEERSQVLWWNDSVIVGELKLASEQREKMDLAWEEFRKKIEPLQRQPRTQKTYLEALERGEWKTAESEARSWLEADQVPKRAMAELKLAVLPILTPEQRTRLIEAYPRLVRRSWRPNPRWGIPVSERTSSRKKPQPAPKPKKSP